MATLEERLEALEQTINQWSQWQHAPEGAEQSFPVPEWPLSDEQDRQRFRAFPTGVIDRGDFPFRITSDDNAMSVTVHPGQTTGRAELVIDGVFYALTEPVTLQVPGVVAATPVTIAAQFRPDREPAGPDQPVQPIRLGIFLGDLSRTQGQRYVPLYRGTRQPSQLVSSIQWVEARPRVVPRLLVDRPEYLPEPGDGLLWGTEVRVHTTGELLQYRGSDESGQWRNLSNPPWTPLYLPSARYWPSFGYEPTQQRHPWGWKVRGVIRTTGTGGVFLGGTTYTIASLQGVGPGTAIPQLGGVLRRQGVFGLGERGELLIERNGDIRVTPQRDVTTIALDGLEAYIS